MSEKISNEQLNQIGEWIGKRTNATCPFCGAVDWSIDDELGSLPAFQGREPHVQLDRGYTFVLVTCNGCGFTAHFSAKKVQQGAG